MSTTTLDCRGLACPGPVLRCLECIEKEAPLAVKVIVDDPGALENVARLLAGKGFAVSRTQNMGEWTICASRDAAMPAAAPTPTQAPQGKTVVFITAESIGAGSDELGGKLMLSFLATLPELGQSLWRVVLVNGGVRLACEGHPCLEKLQALAKGGVTVLVCGTCLGFFGLTDQKRVGDTTNMLDVVTSLSAAGKVIQI